MKLNRWILPLHLLAIAIASGVAIQTDREATKLMALAIALLVAGWASLVSAVIVLFAGLIKGRMSGRETVMLVILILIGLYEKNAGAHWYAYLTSLPG